jgi:hypothetical protein
MSAWVCIHSGNALATNARPAAVIARRRLAFRIDRNLHQPAAFKGLEGRGERGAVHKAVRHAAERRRFRPVQRHQQRKLTMRETERTEHIVETSRQSARGALHVKTQTIVTHQMSGGKW